MLPAVRPNASLREWYQGKLDDLVYDLQASVVFWLRARYRSTGMADGGPLAVDASPVPQLQLELKRLTKRWSRRFEKLGAKLAADFTDRAATASESSLKGSLRSRGLKIKFTMSDEMQTAYEAVRGEQIQLITSLAAEHLSDVEGLVMRSVARGRDLAQLTKQLQMRYSLTRKRAALIARDQNNKATSTIQSARQRQLGIEEGVWRHSHAGKTPRPSHVKADGERFRLDRGMYLDGKWVIPGEEINCRCTWDPVLPGLD